MYTLPCSFEAFDDAFPTPDHCWSYLRHVHWGGESEFQCPRCFYPLGYTLEGRGVFQCANPNCRHQTSLTADTIFHHTKLCIRSWFKGMALYSEERDITVRRFSALLELPYKTAWLLLKKLRLAYEQFSRGDEEHITSHFEEMEPQGDKPEEEGLYNGAVRKIVHEDGTEETIYYYDKVEEASFTHSKGIIRYMQRRKRKRNIAKSFYFSLFSCVSVPPLADILRAYAERDPLDRYLNQPLYVNKLH